MRATVLDAMFLLAACTGAEAQPAPATSSQGQRRDLRPAQPLIVGY